MLISFIVPIVLIFFTNIYMYVSINATIEKVNQIYVTNVNLNDLSERLTLVQNSVKEYLENKGTSALNSYYAAELDYQNSLNNMNNDWASSEMAAMQQNIVKQSDNYFAVVQETIQAKRGRNVEKYKSSYEETVILCEDLHNCIYSLNNDRFKSNTDNYSQLLSSLRRMEFITIILLVFIALVNVIVVALVTKSMTTPLSTLSVAANEVARGNFDVDIESYYVWHSNESTVKTLSCSFVGCVDPEIEEIYWDFKAVFNALFMPVFRRMVQSRVLLINSMTLKPWRFSSRR